MKRSVLFWTLEGGFLVLVLFSLFLVGFSYNMHMRLNISLSRFEGTKSKYWGCSPEDVVEKLQENLSDVEQERSNIKSQVLLLSDLREITKDKDSPGLFFMRSVRAVVDRYKDKKIPENLGFPVAMPDEADIAYLLYNLEAIKRVLEVVDDKNTSLNKVSFDFSERRHLMVMDIMTDFKGLLAIVKSLQRKPIILIEGLEVVSNDRPFINLSIKIDPDMVGHLERRLRTRKNAAAETDKKI